MVHRKHVKLDFGVKEIRLSPGRRHRCLRFASGNTVRFVEEMTIEGIRALISTNTTSKLRMPVAEVSSAVEAQDGENFVMCLRHLEGKVSQLDKDLEEMEKGIAELGKENAKIKKKIAKIVEFCKIFYPVKVLIPDGGLLSLCEN